MLTLLIDGDILAMRSASVNKEDGPAAWDHCRETMVWGMQELSPDEPCRAIVALSCRTRRYFRHDVFPDYKAGRPPPPPALAYVKDAIYSECPCVEWAGMEADDVLGVMATGMDPEGCIIWADDKDMGTLPNVRWTRTGTAEGITHITPEQADRAWMMQTLTGDSVDGYPGIPRVGPVKAARILGEAKGLDAMWRSVVNAYEHRGLTADDALISARLARILRHGDLDLSTLTPTLWRPEQ